MSRYTCSLLIAVPVELTPVAAPIAQAFDPDSGGARSFDTISATDAQGNIFPVCYSPVTAETAAATPYLQSIPGLLYQTVTRDFEARWTDQVPPTLEECEAFRTAIKFNINTSLEAGLAEHGLTVANDHATELNAHPSIQITDTWP